MKNENLNTVLWIDDDEHFLKSLPKIFFKQNIKIEPFSNIEKGISALSKIDNKYSHIMVDLNFNKYDELNTNSDGFEAIKRIREMNPTIPISIISAHLSEPYWNEKLDSLSKIDSTYLVLEKPISVETSDNFIKFLEQIKQTQKKYSDEKEFNTEVNQVKTSINLLNSSFIDIIAKDPNILHNLFPTQFEELIAELFEKQGFIVDLTLPTRDGGKDMYAYKINPYGKTVYAIECKRYNMPNKVGRPILQKLYGVIEQEKLSGGILATSSYFTKDAIVYADPIKCRLFLQDYNNIMELVNKYKNYS